jgi:hypothetical protein
MLLRNTNYSLQVSKTQVFLQSKASLVHFTLSQSVSLGFILVLISPLRQFLTSDLLPEGFKPKFPHTFAHACLISHYFVHCP